MRESDSVREMYREKERDKERMNWRLETIKVRLLVIERQIYILLTVSNSQLSHSFHAFKVAEI